MSALHTLFVREHNLLCDELRAHYRTWSDERIYQTARLIVTALIAKIHTVEWTPAILATKAIDIALKQQLARAALRTTGSPRLGIWLIDVHAATGIPKTKPDHHGAPFCLTEDFVTVYRLHPLLPDDYRLLRLSQWSCARYRGFLDIQGDFGRRRRCASSAWTMCSTPSASPIPARSRCTIIPSRVAAGLRARQNGELIDLSVVDIVRTRRRGVPRYNDFRDRPAQGADQALGGASPRTPRRCGSCATSTATTSMRSTP